MKAIFIDTVYWIALINPKDQWHDRAAEVRDSLEPFKGITTEPVLIEVANYFGSFGSEIRKLVAVVLQDILDDPQIEMVRHTHEDLRSGLTLYANRPDKTYSLTDCVSMLIMRQRGITEVLTHDRHFAQEGLTLLL